MGAVLRIWDNVLQYAVAWKGAGGAAWTIEQGNCSGRNPTSNTNNYNAVHNEANCGFLDNVATAQNIGAGGTTPIFLDSLHVQVALVGTLTITGFTKVDGTTAITKVFPIGSVGQLITPGDCLRMETGCTMTLSVANDGGSASNLWNIRVAWRPI